jgi:cytochrome c oxidase subunit 2
MEQTMRYSSLAKPQSVWWSALGPDERLWTGIAVLWGLAMFAMIVFIWPLIGHEQNNIQSYRIEPTIFHDRTEAFIAAHQLGELGGVPIVAPPPGSDVYLEAAMFSWRPIVQLRQGRPYKLLMSSRDVQHGFSLVMAPHSINFQVLPGYITEITLTPEHTGEYQILCNEYCGIGHHYMIGRVRVTE